MLITILNWDVQHNVNNNNNNNDEIQHLQFPVDADNLFL